MCIRDSHQEVRSYLPPLPPSHDQYRQPRNPGRATPTRRRTSHPGPTPARQCALVWPESGRKRLSAPIEISSSSSRRWPLRCIGAAPGPIRVEGRGYPDRGGLHPAPQPWAQDQLDQPEEGCTRDAHETACSEYLSLNAVSLTRQSTGKPVLPRDVHTRIDRCCPGEVAGPRDLRRGRG